MHLTDGESGECRHHVAHKREEVMKLSRRHLAAAGALALGAPALIRSAHAQSADEAAVKNAVEELRMAWLKQNKAKIESLTAEQLSYSHSDARLGDNAIVRHLWVSESELDGKVTNTKIGVMQVWQKQDGGWKLLARASWRLPPPA